jgi:hypothetical protein
MLVFTYPLLIEKLTGLSGVTPDVLFERLLICSTKSSPRGDSNYESPARTNLLASDQQTCVSMKEARQ